MPFPSLVRSYFARAVLALLFFYVIFQICGYLQLFVASGTGFVFTAIVMSAAVLALQYMRRPQIRAVKVIMRSDLYTVLTAAIFIVPVALFCFGPNGVYRSATLGGMQAIDGTNHYSFIAEATAQEGLKYSAQNNYPIGFHLTTGFIEDSYALTPDELTWASSSKVYIAQYLIVAFLLSYTAYLLTVGMYRTIRDKTQTSLSEGLSIALALGIPLTLFFLLPYFYNGFLSFYYICATVLAGCLYLLDIRAQDENEDEDTAKDRHIPLTCFLLLTFAATANWPLLAPAFVLTGLLYWLPRTLKIPALTLSGIRATVPVVLAFGLHLVPVYLQSKYSSQSASESINLNGSLYSFHASVILLGIILLVYLVSSDRIHKRLANLATFVLMPLLILLGCLAIYQYFSVGELRYYVIKTSLLVEVLILTIFVATLFGLIVRRLSITGYKLMLLMAVVPTMTMMLLIGQSGNPIREERALLRAFSSEKKPPFFDNDVTLYYKLSQRESLQEFNSVSIHYDFEQQKFFSHMQIPYWANVLGYGAAPNEREAARCNLKAYQNLLFGTFSQKDQSRLIQTIQRCAQIAGTEGETFYIITDKASHEEVAREFGKIPAVRIVY
jgi:hypothetical protein